MNPRLKEFFFGMRAGIPLLIGVFPFGMIYGVLAIEAGLEKSAAQAMSAIVFAGSSQFIAAQLIPTGIPGLVLVLTIFIVNLRHALYSASLAPYLKNLSLGWKALLAYFLVDEAYAVAISHYNEPGDKQYRHFAYLGAGLSLWTVWQTSTALGILLGSLIPASWALDFTLALTFIALVVPGLKDRPTIAAALVAGVTAVLAYGLPYKLGIMLAAFLGILAAMGMEKWGAKVS